MNREQELELVARAARGDGAAYEALLRHLEPDLKGFLRGILRHRPDASVDDALQDLRIYLYQRLDRYNPEYPLDVFARGLARNVAKRHLYRKSDLVLGEEDDEEAGFETELSGVELGALPQNFQDVLGVARFEEPDGGTGPSREFLEVLELFLRYGGYPHQQVSFGWSILIWGKDKREEGKGRGEAAPGKVPVTGEPDRVVHEIGPRRLEDASVDMREEIRTGARLDEPFTRRAWAPLDARLAMTGAALFARDGTSRAKFKQFAESVIGRTELQAYFGKDPRGSVAEWTRAVKDRIKKAVEDPASRARTVLPAAEPTPP